MERMWSTDRTAGRDDQLDDGVLGQADDAAFRHEVLCLLRAAQDLEQHGHCGRRKARIVNQEAEIGEVLFVLIFSELCRKRIRQQTYKGQGQRDRLVSATSLGLSRLDKVDLFQNYHLHRRMNKYSQLWD